jgi:hypothetical protein
MQRHARGCMKSWSMKGRMFPPPCGHCITATRLANPLFAEVCNSRNYKSRQVRATQHRRTGAYRYRRGASIILQDQLEHVEKIAGNWRRQGYPSSADRTIKTGDFLLLCRGKLLRSFCRSIQWRAVLARFPTPGQIMVVLAKVPHAYAPELRVGAAISAKSAVM